MKKILFQIVCGAIVLTTCIFLAELISSRIEKVETYQNNQAIEYYEEQSRFNELDYAELAREYREQEKSAELETKAELGDL